MRALGQHRGGHLLQRCDVEDLYRATMRAGDQLVVARMHLQVIDRHRWEIAVEHEPARALVERGVDAQLGAHVEEVRVHRVLAHHIDRVGASSPQSIADRAKRLAEVGGDEDIRSEVVVTMIVEAHIDRGRIAEARLHLAHVREGRHAGEAATQVLPTATVVAREPDLAVVGAHVEQARPDRRFADRHDRRVLLGAGRVARDATGRVRRRIAVGIVTGGDADAGLVA